MQVIPPIQLSMVASSLWPSFLYGEVLLVCFGGKSNPHKWQQPMLVSGLCHCVCSPFNKSFLMYGFCPCHKHYFPLALRFGIPCLLLANFIILISSLTAARSCSDYVFGFCLVALFLSLVPFLSYSSSAHRFLVSSWFSISWFTINLAFSLFSDFNLSICC